MCGVASEQKIKESSIQYTQATLVHPSRCGVHISVNEDQTLSDVVVCGLSKIEMWRSLEPQTGPLQRNLLEGKLLKQQRFQDIFEDPDVASTQILKVLGWGKFLLTWVEEVSH